jgi:DNA ligase-1
MLRDPQGIYKSGRSTLKQQILIKLKRLCDDEATIIGFEALNRNQNPKTLDAFGLAKRSSVSANKVPDNLLGKLQVRSTTFGDFSIGSGFDVDLRTHIWNNQEAYLGKVVCFKYQKVGTIVAPRHPIYKGLRGD